MNVGDDVTRGNCAIRLLLFLIFAGSFEALALDPARTINQYGHDVWVRQNGLPATGVNVCLQTRDGYLWIGTTGGLFRFDGMRFKAVSTNQDIGADLENISALCESRDGMLWIGTEYGGLRCLKDGVVAPCGADGSFDERQIHVLYESSLGHLWVGTSDGLYRLVHDRFQRIPLDVKYLTGITEDARGRIWVATHEGLRVLDAASGEQVASYNVSDGLPDKITTTILTDRSGDVWIGMSRGLARWHNGTWKTFTAADGLSSNHVLALHEDRDGSIWAGTLDGLSRYARGRWTTYTTTEGLTNPQVISISEDREGSLWAGTLEGLNRFKDVNLVPFTTKEGLGNNYVSGLAESSDGSLYFLSNANSTVTRYKDGRMTTQVVRGVGPAYAARDGSLWMGQNGLLTRIKNGTVTYFDAHNGIPQEWISAITEDDRSLILYVDKVGLCRFHEGKISPYLPPNDPAREIIRFVECFHVASDGTLWIGTTDGLVRMQRGKATLFGPAEGLADRWISAISDDRRGNLWLSLAHGGLTRYREGAFTAYNSKRGLFTNEIYGAVADDRGDLWLSSPRGIGHVTCRDLDDLDAGKTSKLSTQVFTTADGMKTDACFNEWSPNVLKTRDGRLWFATKKGAVMIDPLTLRRNELIPQVYIEDMVADGTTVSATEPFALPPGTGNIEFHYTGLSFLAPERVMFRYKLEGYDKYWIDAGTRRVAYYTNLPPGPYRFRVTACNNNGIWNKTGAAVGFSHAPHFYQTYTFYAVCIGMTALCIFVLYRMRVRNLEEREHQLEQLVHERTTELQEQRSSLQEQRSFLRKIIDLNPSFIFAKDRDGRFTLANRALARAYGVSVDEIIGRTDADFIRCQDEAKDFRRDDLEVFETNNEKFIPEEEFTDKEGQRHWLQTTKIPITADGGEPRQVLGVSTDITLQMAAKEAAEAATRAKSEFLANMSHEIRTPMNAVIGMTGLLLDTPLSDRQREYVEIVRSSSDALLTIINDILDFSKIESGKLTLEQQPFSLAGCIEESLDLLSSKAVEKGIDLAYVLDENTPHDLVGDVTRVRQILVNLIGNAVKFTHNGEVVISVSSRRMADTRHEVQFSVRDTGIGIPKERMDRLFKSFSQVDSSTTRHYGGTGLGLAISKKLSELMGGSMSVESQEGKGSTFTFTIAASSAPTPPRVHLHPDQPALAAKRVLVVDDNETNRRILLLKTQAWGMAPEAHANGDEALDLVKEGRTFDVAILDTHMPGMEGGAFARELRRLHSGRPLPLILLTNLASCSQTIKEHCGDQADLAILTTPIKPAQLFDALLGLLGARPAAETRGAPPAKLDGELAIRLPLRILLAEDNVVNQKVALRVLERFGYRADVAGNGVEAIDALHRQPYDLIFMDVQMPEMDGLEATRRICEEWKENRPRIIAMTANATQGDREMCFSTGMDGYISKPVRVEELRAALEQFGAARKA